jgi:fatty-acyl-CoA synthase
VRAAVVPATGALLPLGPEVRTLDEMLARRAAGAPDALAFAAVADDAGRERDGEGDGRLTYGALRADALALAGGLARLGVGRHGRGGRDGGEGRGERSERVALLLPAGLGFVQAFFALQRLAAVPFALSPQLPPDTAARSAARVRPRLVLVAGPAAGELAAACDAVGLHAIDLAAVAGSAGVRLAPADGGPDDPAFLQATSGTSGEARAAIVLQRNALASLAAARERLEIGPSDVLVGWVPPWHDLGLLRFVLGPVYCGAPCYLVPPAIRTLPLWLRTAAQVRATILGAPDFAYRLATRMVDPAGLDLSALRYATNGGEPVRQSTIVAFEERFAVPGTLRPGYGLAEATLGVTCLAPGEPLRADARGNVSCGRPLPGVEIRIAPAGPEASGGAGGTGAAGGVDACGVGTGEVCGFGDAAGDGDAHGTLGAFGALNAVNALNAPNALNTLNALNAPNALHVVGEILVRGPGVFAGYFAAEEESREVLRDGWLHTGDVGAVDGDGHLYVLGRQRAMLKRGGAPLAPREVEEAAERVAGVRAAVAIGLPPAGAAAASEAIAVVLEADASRVDSFSRLAAAAAAAIEAALGFAPAAILALAPRSLPRTPNGKVQHQILRRALLDGTLDRRGVVLFDSRQPAAGSER